ncbi:MAG: glycosyl transferase, partial [Hyphomicrobiales bacterium]|nr:glycosyl transferase [Hyphomicrobiales bacterium]
MSTTLQSQDAPSPLRDALDLVRNQQLSLQELFRIAEAAKTAGAPGDSVEIYKTWIAFNPDHPHAHLAYFNMSVALTALGDRVAAAIALQACLKQDPLFGPANVNLGRTYEDMGQQLMATRHWLDYVEKTSLINGDQLRHKVLALEQIGRVCEKAEVFGKAEDVLKQAIELRPDKTEAGQHWIALRQRQCKWPVLQRIESVPPRQLMAAMSPFALAAYADDPMYQFARAYRCNQTLVGRPDLRAIPRPTVKKKTGTGQRLRIGYVSSDLREHAVGFALCELFELHDKSSVEIFAYYSNNIWGDAVQERMKKAADHWRDIEAISDQQAAAQIVADEIDILVDLNGITSGARTGIFAYRPAPVGVNWCGYPGTMATPYHQYMITDDVIVPPSHELYYSEK